VSFVMTWMKSSSFTMFLFCFYFFFSSRRRHTRSKRDWSSDVCSSDLENYQGPFYVFIGINRNQEAIENVSFDLSLFNKDDHLIWDDKAILLTDDEVGTIPKDTVFPILVPLNKNTMNEIKKVD